MRPIVEFYGWCSWFCILVWLAFDLTSNIAWTATGVVFGVLWVSMVALALYAAIMICMICSFLCRLQSRTEKTVKKVAQPSPPQWIEVKLYLMSIWITLARIGAVAVAAQVIVWLAFPVADPSAKSLWAIATATWQDTLCLVAAPFVLGGWFYGTSGWVNIWRRAGGHMPIPWWLVA